MTRILLIEDNPEVRENTSEILTLANYDVLTAENGRVGVEIAQRELPDLIICDIMMPELDGFGVLHILSKKPETAGIPFIFLTAKTEKTDFRKGMELGADDYLTKPFEDSDLLNAVEVRIKKRQLYKKDYTHDLSGFESFIKDAQHVLNMKELGKDLKARPYKKKANIFQEGDLPGHIYFVKSGRVKAYMTHPDGKELITNLYSPNTFFGFEPALENKPYGESAVAMEDSEIVAIPRVDFLALIERHREVAATFISLLCRKVTEKENQLLQLAYNSVRQRTAETLLRLFGKNPEAVAVSRHDLAKIVGTAPESVIRVISDFRDEGLIEISASKIKVIDPARLEKVVRWNVALR